MGTLTLHLAMLLFDRLSSESVKSSNWPLMTLTCFILAAKFQERDDDIPLIEDCITVTNVSRKTSILYDQVTKNEYVVLKELNWEINKVTPYHFVKNYISQGIIFTNDYIIQAPLSRESSVTKSANEHYQTPPVHVHQARFTE